MREESLDFVRFERFLVQEGVGESLDGRPVAIEQLVRAAVPVAEDLLDLLVDTARGGLAQDVRLVGIEVLPGLRNARMPSADMPHSQTMCCAMSVARSMSFEAPLVM